MMIADPTPRRHDDGHAFGAGAPRHGWGARTFAEDGPCALPLAPHGATPLTLSLGRCGGSSPPARQRVEGGIDSGKARARWAESRGARTMYSRRAGVARRLGPRPRARASRESRPSPRWLRQRGREKGGPHGQICYPLPRRERSAPPGRSGVTHQRLCSARPGARRSGRYRTRSNFRSPAVLFTMSSLPSESHLAAPRRAVRKAAPKP
jgi:hypothetical protein